MGKHDIDNSLGTWFARLNFQQQIRDGFFRIDGALGLSKQEVDASIYPLAIVRRAKMDSLTPKELVAREITTAILNKDHSVRQEDHFFVIGNDALGHSFYLCDSAERLDDARVLVEELESTDGKFDEPADKFTIFNREGVPISA